MLLFNKGKLGIAVRDKCSVIRRFERPLTTLYVSLELFKIWLSCYMLWEGEVIVGWIPHAVIYDLI